MNYDIFIVDDPHRHYTDHDIIWMLAEVLHYDDSRAANAAHYIIKEGKFCIHSTNTFEEAEHYANSIANANAWGYHIVVLKGDELVKEWGLGPCSIDYPDCDKPVVFMSDVKSPDMSRLYYCKEHGEWMMSKDPSIVLIEAKPSLMPDPRHLRS